MKLILTQDVTAGDSGDVVEVWDGYGRNFLVPAAWPSAGAGRGTQIDQIRRARQAVRSATWTMPVRSNRPSRVCRSTSRHTPPETAGWLFDRDHERRC